MKFCYCPECKELHPKNWYSGSSCERCLGSCVIISVPSSLAGYLMYAFSVVAVGLIVLNLLGTEWALSGYSVPLIFLAIIASFVCAFIEIGKGTDRAYERIRKKA